MGGFCDRFNICAKMNTMAACKKLTVTATTAAIRESSSSVNKSDDVKPFDAMPRQFSLPFFGSVLNTVLSGKYSWGDSHKIISDRLKKFGNIYRDNFWGTEMVISATPESAAAMFRNEGQYPTRTPVEVWKLPRQMVNLPLSVFLR